MKKTVSIILCAVLCISLLASCGNNSKPSGEPSQKPSVSDLGGDQTSVIGTTVDKDSETKYKESLTVICDNTQMSVLDPAHPQAGGQGSVMNFSCFLNTLVANDNGTVVPELATSWDVEGYQHYTFYLRDDVYFHNGEKFTADDVKFSIEHAKEALGGTAYSRFNYVDAVEIINDYTIKLSLSQVNSDFIYYLYSPNCSILNREAVEADPEKGAWIGTGPWIVEEFVSNEYSRLKVNEDYWGEVPVTKSLRFIKVGEEATRYMMLMNDEVDVAFGCSPADFDSINENPDFNLFTFVICNVGFVGFNMTDPLMQDINFRKAVSCLLNRSEIIAGTRYGYAAIPPSGAFWGHTTMYRNMDLKLQDYDVELAKEYLAKSSYDGVSEVEVAGALGEFKTIAQILQSELINLGVNATFFETDMAGFSAHTKFDNNKSQIFSHSGGWSNYASSAVTFYSKDSSNNKASYVNNEIIELFKTATTTTDDALREESYKKAQQIAYDECVYIPTMSIQHAVGCAKDVGGIILTEENTHDLSQVFRIIE